MRVSYNWLQTYFDTTLPAINEVAHGLTMHSFEVEAIESVGQDTIFSIDILPNRAHDCLSHLGVARELSVIFNIPLIFDPLGQSAPEWAQSGRVITSVEDPSLCERYSAMVVSGVKVGETSSAIKTHLQAIGQKPINNLVDIANFVMFSMGQPLHIFDMGKMKIKDGMAGIDVRRARSGEKITCLDSTEYILEESDLVIADHNTDEPMALAGIKGAVKNAVDSGTEHIIIESANFNSLSIRKTSKRLKLRTDASVRFEHGLSPELTAFALKQALSLIQQECQDTTVELDGVNDIYPNNLKPESIVVSFNNIDKILGTEVQKQNAEKHLCDLGFEVETKDDSFIAKPPFFRRDIVGAQDVIEEIGRTLGYQNIEPSSIHGQNASNINKRFFYTEMVRDFLTQNGFSEVYTYTIGEQGAMELQNPLASDKNFLRRNLAPGLEKASVLNAGNADLLGLDNILIFEFGNVFTEQGEFYHIGISTKNINKQKKINIQNILEQSDLPVMRAIGAQINNTFEQGTIEYDFDTLIAELEEPKQYKWSKEKLRGDFMKISPFPFIVRDISVWASEQIKNQEILTLINQERAGEILVNTRLIDIYKKDGRISYSFRLVFQSMERTLTDEEVNLIMWHISANINSRPEFETR